MNRFFLFLLTLTIAAPVHAQYSKQDLINDLTFLDEAVRNGHPVNYDPRQKKVDINSVIEQAKNGAPDSLTALQYTLWIEKGIFHIGCIHTSIRTNPLRSRRSKFSFIPLDAFISNERLVISSCIDSLLVGARVDRINGHHVTEIIDTFKEYKASDGVSAAFAREYFHYASSGLISSFLQYPEDYYITTDKGVFTLKGDSGVYKAPGEKAKPVNARLSNKGNRYYEVDDFAVLEIRSFSKSDKSFFRSVFAGIDRNKNGNLLIDLRQNTGGNRGAAIELTRHIVDSSFRYSILQPRLKIRKYLNSKGKRYFFLSKIRYNLLNLHHRRRNPLGKEFRYTYRPKRTHNFDGRLFILTDGFTASASTMVTAWLKQFTNTTFIGSQSGGGYNGNNGGTFPLITLPASKIEIKFPAYRLILDEHSELRSGLVPDAEVERGEAIEAVMGKIRQR